MADKPSPRLVAKRRAAAEEVCWTVILMMSLGLLPIPYKNRPMLAEPMQKWSDLAAQTGLLAEENS